MTDLTVFNNPAFGVRNLTTAINIVPDMDTIWNRMGLFTQKSIRTTHFSVEYKNGVVNLIPSQTRGGPAAKNRGGKRNLRSFEVPHFPLEDAIMADDVQNVRAFGTENALEGVMELVNERLIDMGNKHYVTKEWLRNGAVHGKILDADGSVMLDLFSEFGVTEEVFDFDFAGSPDIEKTCAEIRRYFRKIAKGETVRDVLVLGSPGFMDKLLQDESVKEAYRYFQTVSGQNPNRDNVRNFFRHYDMVFQEYDGTVDYVDPNTGTTVTYDYIADGEARIIPLGTRNVFHEYLAPADFMETANTLGKAMYAKQEPMKWNKGIEIHTQTNVLPFVTRPEFLVKAR